MGRDYCTVFGCHNFSGRIGKFGHKVTLHKLPKEQYARRAWIRAISRKNWIPSNYTRVCSDHFISGIGPNYANRSKIPTENLPQKRSGAVKTLRSSPRKRPQPQPSDKTSFNDLNLHSYAQVQPTRADDGLKSVGTRISGMTPQATQTCPPSLTDVGTETLMPELVIENINHSNVLIMFYTGLPDSKTFHALFETLMEHGADKLSTESIGEMNSLNLGRKRKLRRIDEFLLVMMRLRLGLLLKDLEYRFKTSASSVSKIFNAWILFMSVCLRSIVLFPKLKDLQMRVPKRFKQFSDTRVTLDCTEIFVQSPSSLENKSLTYSSYKSHDTFKALIGVSTTGAVVFVSKLWPGCTSDVEITRCSGLYDHLEKGDAVMLDKGFIHIQSDLKQKGVKLYCPPFNTKVQFSKAEVEMTRRIASARIHVERKMEQIKNFRILQGVIPLALSEFADHVFFVCTALTNLLPPLVAERFYVG